MLKPDGVTFETVTGVGGVNLRVAVAGQGPLIVLVHGFPESWYSWRAQIPFLVGLGYKVAAMDVRGYGGSGAPEAIEAYDMQTMTGDVASVIDALGDGSPAVVIGHDWGAPIAWNTALVHPRRVRAVAGMSVPHSPAGEYSLLDFADMAFTKAGRFFYIVYFQEPGAAEAELEADVRTTLAKIYYFWSGEIPADARDAHKPVGDVLLNTVPHPGREFPWFTAADLDYYASQFERSGFRGPLNRYRNFARDRAFLHGLPDGQKIMQPALFLAGKKDGVLRMFPTDPVEAMQPHFADLRGCVLIDDIGHWTQQEAPDATNAALKDWLAGL